jgi:beta-glucuronidase
VSGLPANALAHLHDAAYGRAYEHPTLDHRGLIHVRGRPRTSLAGSWQFTIDPFEEGLRQRWHADCFRPLEGRTAPFDYALDPADPGMPVPACFNLVRPELFHYEGMAWYGRWLEGLEARPGERLFLRVGAAPYACRLFLDGVFLGCHLGASTPFLVELTDRLGARSFLHLALDNARRPERVPTHHFDWFNYGGLFREVELFRLPAVFVEDLFVRLAPDGGLARIAVDLRLSDPVDGTARLAIPELGVDRPVAVEGGVGTALLEARPELWSPERPRLYEVEVRFGADRVADRVGFREIRVEGERILLNGAPVFLKGICVHEDDAAVGRVASEADLRRRFGHARELGCNFLRLAHYPHHERTAELADELGFMLWEEIPVYWAVAFDREDTLADARNQLAELILRDRNRASVVVWGVGNENADSDARLAFMARLAATARELDGTRPVSAACLVDRAACRIDDRLVEHLDVVGINEYYGWYEPDLADLARILAHGAGGKPIVITETGAEAPAGRSGGRDEPFTEERMAAVLEAQLEAVARAPSVQGFCPWLLYDFRSLRRLGPTQRGWNRKGLLAEDKETRKQAFAVIRQAYAR